MPDSPPARWKPWNFGHVVDADFPAFALRTYLEHVDVRSHLHRAAASSPLESACEIGCGYGRMTVVLGEFAARVTGFERQPEFVQLARRLHPTFTFHEVASLARLPAPDRSFDFVLTFTVMQHLTDRVVSLALAEAMRIVKPGGHLLLCEDTNPASRHGEVTDDSGMCVIGRSVEVYARMLPTCRLLSTKPRRVEPTYPVADVGTYMLFSAPPDDRGVPEPDGLSATGTGTGGRPIKLELGCGAAPTPGYTHHDKQKHAPHVDAAHDLDMLPWPWSDSSCEEILGLDVFEHLHLMPEQWLRECFRLLRPGGILRLRVPIFGSPWHLIDPTHVRGFHPLNFDYFTAGRELHGKFGHFYFDFAFRDAQVQIDGHNIVATMVK